MIVGVYCQLWVALLLDRWCWWHKKTGWARHGEQICKQHPLHVCCFSSHIQAPSLASFSDGLWSRSLPYWSYFLIVFYDSNRKHLIVAAINICRDWWYLYICLLVFYSLNSFLDRDTPFLEWYVNKTTLCFEKNHLHHPRNKFWDIISHFISSFEKSLFISIAYF